MDETKLRRPLLAALLFGAGFVTAQDISHGGPVAVSMIISFVVWLNVAFG